MTHTNEMMILIVGAASRVGRLLEGALERRFPNRVVAATREEIDLTDRDRVFLEIDRLEPAPTVIVNCAAVTDPARAERAPHEVMQTNREGVANLSRAAKEIGSRIIHFSTVEVFDGRKKMPYVEEDLPSPATPYGQHRYLGELAVAEANPDHLVIRLSLLCGDGVEGDPLLRIGDAIRDGRHLEWEERRVSPIFAEDLESCLPAILISEWKGVLHLANAGSCFLSELVAKMGRLLQTGTVPELVGGTGPGSFTPAWGPNGTLDAARFTHLSGRRLREWDVALANRLSLWDQE